MTILALIISAMMIGWQLYWNQIFLNGAIHLALYVNWEKYLPYVRTVAEKQADSWGELAVVVYLMILAGVLIDIDYHFSNWK